MGTYLLQPVTIERLRATLERWLPVQGESDAITSANQGEPIAELDLDVIAAKGSLLLSRRAKEDSHEH